MIDNLGKKESWNLAVRLAKDVLSNLATKEILSILNKVKKVIKVSREGVSRAWKTIHFFSYEDINETLKW